MEEKTVTHRVWSNDFSSYEDRVIGTGKYVFTEEDKMSIVSEYVVSGRPAHEIIKKYHVSTRQTLFNWMDKYINERELVSLPETEEEMAKKTPEQRIKELEAENQRLNKALALEKLRSEAFDTMITLAEETFNIPVRKKSGTKQ